MSRQRFLDALRGPHGAEGVSFGTGTSIACVDLMEATGARFPEAHLDADMMADLAITGHTVLGFDVVMPLFSVCHEAAAMGCKVKMIAETGLAGFHWDTKTGRPEDVRALAGPELALMGGVSNFTLLRGTPQEVQAQARAAAAADINIVGPECAIPLTTPLGNLKAVAQDLT